MANFGQFTPSGVAHGSSGDRISIVRAPVGVLEVVIVLTLFFDRMIAVMTMNVGFFFAVLVGYFIGELIFGRVARAD